MDKSDSNCYCGRRGDQIHHLDKDPSNNDPDNLILLCYEHHHDASVIQGLKRQLSVKQLKKLRYKLYSHNENKGKLQLKEYGAALRKVTEVNIFRASMDAAIIIELIKLSEECYNESDWSRKNEILWKFKKFSDYLSFNVATEFFKHLNRMSDFTRSGMTAEFSSTFYHMVTDFFPPLDRKKDNQRIERIGEMCGHMAFAICYDAFIYLGNLAVAANGLEILKYLYLKGTEYNNSKLKNIVYAQYKELERTLNRPERNDLVNATRLLSAYKEHLTSNSFFQIDELPKDLYKQLLSDREL